MVLVGANLKKIREGKFTNISDILASSHDNLCNNNHICGNQCYCNKPKGKCVCIPNL